jgi:hypothetical protein
MEPIVKDLERRTVENFLEAVIRDAYYMADLTAAFLKSQGFRPRRKHGRTSCVLCEGSPASTRVQGFLLNLAAALRIAAWERAGLQPDLPADLPNSAEAFQNVVPAEVPNDQEDAPFMPALYAKVLQTWLQRFSRSSRAALNADIMLPVKAVSEDELLDGLAEFLLANRHLADIQEG